MNLLPFVSSFVDSAQLGIKPQSQAQHVMKASGHSSSIR